MGIVSGSNGKLNINDTMTRAEMATIFSKTCSYIDTAKEMLADKEQAKKDKEEADKNAEQEIQGNDYKKTTVTESKAYDGEDASFTNCTIDFASQKDSVLKMANGTLVYLAQLLSLMAMMLLLFQTMVELMWKILQFQLVKQIL